MKFEINKLVNTARVPLAVMGGHYGGNYLTNKIVDNAIQVSGIGRIIGQANAERGKSIIKILLPLATGLLGYENVEDEDLKNVFIGVASSGVKFGMDAMLEKNMSEPVYASIQRIAGDGGGVATIKSSELDELINIIDNKIQSEVNGALPHSIYQEDEDYDFDNLNGNEDYEGEIESESVSLYGYNANSLI